MASHVGSGVEGDVVEVGDLGGGIDAYWHGDLDVAVDEGIRIGCQEFNQQSSGSGPASCFEYVGQGCVLLSAEEILQEDFLAEVFVLGGVVQGGEGIGVVIGCRLGRGRTRSWRPLRGVRGCGVDHALAVDPHRGRVGDEGLTEVSETVDAGGFGEVEVLGGG
jgi:hypothetical protein